MCMCIWAKLRITDGPDKIIGNIYRPNSAPKADLQKAIEVHNKIYQTIKLTQNVIYKFVQILM